MKKSVVLITILLLLSSLIFLKTTRVISSNDLKYEIISDQEILLTIMLGNINKNNFEKIISYPKRYIKISTNPSGLYYLKNGTDLVFESDVNNKRILIKGTIKKVENRFRVIEFGNLIRTEFNTDYIDIRVYIKNPSPRIYSGFSAGDLIFDKKVSLNFGD